jgi:Leucine Rich Repeat
VLLTLQNNNLTGDVPPSLAALAHLETLDLSHNQLGGTLPDLDQVPLRYLYVNNNNFTGAPTVYVDNNEFTGVPTVCVNNNQFTGAHARALDIRGADAEQASLFGWAGWLRETAPMLCWLRCAICNHRHSERDQQWLRLQWPGVRMCRRTRTTDEPTDAQLC